MSTLVNAQAPVLPPAYRHAQITQMRLGPHLEGLLSYEMLSNMDKCALFSPYRPLITSFSAVGKNGKKRRKSGTTSMSRKPKRPRRTSAGEPQVITRAVTHIDEHLVKHPRILCGAL